MDQYICKAKRMDNNEWVYGYYMQCNWYLDDSVMHVIVPKDAILYPYCEISGWYEIDPDTLCRCIGYVDSYNNPIFENDVISFGVSHKDLVWWCREMNMMTAVPLDGIETNGYDYWNPKYPKYEYSAFCLMLQDPYGDFSEIKIIGNIIDNPKLIEV